MSSLVPDQIVVFTLQHSITGGIFLHDRRLSDFLNDRREKNILLRNARLARLDDPGRGLQATLLSILPKAGIVLAFELSQKDPAAPRFIKYPKDTHNVFLTLDGVEVRGRIHVPGSLDLLHVLTDTAESFLPLTQVTITILANPAFLLSKDAVMVNVQHIRFMGEIESQPGAGAPNPPQGE